MGANLSAEEEAIVKLLTQLLIKRGVKYDPFKIKLLLKFLQKQGVPSTVSAVFDVKTWDQAGEKIWEAASIGITNAAEVMTTWRLVTETLRAWQAEKKVQNAAAQAILTAAPGSESDKPPEQYNLIDLGDDQEEGRGPTLLNPTLRTPSAPTLPPLNSASLGA